MLSENPFSKVKLPPFEIERKGWKYRLEHTQVPEIRIKALKRFAEVCLNRVQRYEESSTSKGIFRSVDDTSIVIKDPRSGNTYEITRYSRKKESEQRKDVRGEPDKNLDVYIYFKNSPTTDERGFLLQLPGDLEYFEQDVKRGYWSAIGLTPSGLNRARRQIERAVPTK